MGGSSTQTKQETAQQNPYAPAIPALNTALSSAQQIFDRGVGGNVYTGDRTAGLGDTTQSGLASMAANAGAGTGAADAGNSFLQSLLQGNGTTAGTQAATSALAGVNPNVDASGIAAAAGRLSDPNSAASTVGQALAGGAYQTNASALNPLASNLATGGTQTQRSLQSVANGDYLGGGNPYLNDMIAKSQAEAGSQVAQKFAASGRYGSGRFAGALAEAANNAGNTFRYQDYDQERARQASAAGAIDSANNAQAGAAGSLYNTVSGINQGNAGLATTGAGLAQNAAQAALSSQSTLAGLYGSNADRAMTQANALMSGAQGDRSASLAGLGAVQTNGSNLLQPGQTLAGVGAIQDAARQQELDAAQGLFNDQESAPWKQVGLLSAVANPIAGLGSTSSGTSKTTTPNPGVLQTLIGTALAGANVASKFYGGK